MSVSIYDPELLEYLSFRHSTHLNYRNAVIRPEDYKTLIPQTLKFVQKDFPASVLAASNDPRSILELGIR